MTQARNETVAQLASGLVSDAQRLAHLEIELAKQELRELAVRNGVAVGLMVGGALLAAVGLLVGAALALDLAFGPVAGAVVCGAYFGLGLVGAVVGRVTLRLPSLHGLRTVTTLLETGRWLRGQTESSAR